MNISSPKVMLLIDADNVSADVIEQAVQRTLVDTLSASMNSITVPAVFMRVSSAVFRRRAAA